MITGGVTYPEQFQAILVGGGGSPPVLRAPWVELAEMSASNPS